MISGHSQAPARARDRAGGKERGAYSRAQRGSFISTFSFLLYLTGTFGDYFWLGSVMHGEFLNVLAFLTSRLARRLAGLVFSQRPWIR